MLHASRRFGGALALFALLAQGGAALASPTYFELHDVTFADGGTATGSFDLDAYGYVADTLTSISTQGGTMFPGESYGNAADGIDGPFGTVVTFVEPPSLYVLRLTFAAPLTSGAVDYIVAGAASYECNGYICDAGDSRYITGGYVSFVPEPVSVALLGGGVLALAGVRRRNA